LLLIREGMSRCDRVLVGGGSAAGVGCVCGGPLCVWWHGWVDVRMSGGPAAHRLVAQRHILSTYAIIAAAP